MWELGTFCSHFCKCLSVDLLIKQGRKGKGYRVSKSVFHTRSSEKAFLKGDKEATPAESEDGHHVNVGEGHVAVLQKCRFSFRLSRVGPETQHICHTRRGCPHCQTSEHTLGGLQQRNQWGAGGSPQASLHLASSWDLGQPRRLQPVRNHEGPHMIDFIQPTKGVQQGNDMLCRKTGDRNKYAD